MSSEVCGAHLVPFAGASCAFGVFDGVHEGHRFIISQAVEDGRVHDRPSIIITFDVDPSELFAPHADDKLMSNAERIERLAELGADHVAVIPFDEAVAASAPLTFLDRLFAQGAPRLLLVGEDLRFGCHASGTLLDLASWGASHDMTAQGVPLLEMDGAPVTSTRIRACLNEGKVEEAARLLGGPYALGGEVVAGRKMGREMGICTANLKADPLREVPQDGVYAAYALIEGTRRKAAVSVGVPITFEDATASTIEAHILGFDEDIYGKRLTLEFMERLRPMVKFASSQELVTQIEEDIARTRLLP